jgi:hypothetical protein
MSQSSEFCRHNALCCFSTSVYCCYFVIDSVRKLSDTLSYTEMHEETVVEYFKTLAKYLFQTSEENKRNHSKNRFVAGIKIGLIWNASQTVVTVITLCRILFHITDRRPWHFHYSPLPCFRFRGFSTTTVTLRKGCKGIWNRNSILGLPKARNITSREVFTSPNTFTMATGRDVDIGIRTHESLCHFY